MALRNQPYFPLYVQDFLTDEKLMECSASATGVYIRILCIMHKSEEYGKVLLKQKDKQNDKQILNFACKLAKHFPYSIEIITSALEELLAENVLVIDGDYLIQQRMVKDNKISELRAKSGKKGGEKTLGKTNDFASGFAQAKIQANSEYEYENEIENKNEIVKGGMGEKSEIPVYHPQPFNPGLVQEKFDELSSAQSWLESMAMQWRCETSKIEKLLFDFLLAKNNSEEIQGRSNREIKSYFNNWLKYNIETAKNLTNGKLTAEDREQKLRDWVTN